MDLGLRCASHLTGHGSNTHCQVQILMSRRNWLVLLFHTVSVLLSGFVALCSISMFRFGKAVNEGKFLELSLHVAFLACLLWHFYCTLSKQPLVFPIILKPQAPSVVISVQHLWYSSAVDSACHFLAVVVTHSLVLFEENQMSRFKYIQLTRCVWREMQPFASENHWTDMHMFNHVEF